MAMFTSMVQEGWIYHANCGPGGDPQRRYTETQPTEVCRRALLQIYQSEVQEQAIGNADEQAREV